MQNAEDKGVDAKKRQNAKHKIPGYQRWLNSLPPWVSGVAFVCYFQLFLTLVGGCLAKKDTIFIILLSVTGIGLLVLWLARDEGDPVLMYLLPIGLMVLLLLLLHLL